MNEFLRVLASVADTAVWDRGDGAPMDASQRAMVTKLRAAVADVLQPHHLDLFVLRFLVATNYDLTQVSRACLDSESHVSRLLAHLVSKSPPSLVLVRPVVPQES